MYVNGHVHYRKRGHKATIALFLWTSIFIILMADMCKMQFDDLHKMA